MQYEVELKFRISGPSWLEERLRVRAATFQQVEHHADHYFDHPARSFRETDEAVRLRVQEALEEPSGPRQGECDPAESRSAHSGRGQMLSASLTYKGPVIDRLSKTRHEIEVPLLSGSDGVEQALAWLRATSFRPVAVVRKSRRVWALPYGEHAVAVVIDRLDGLGYFAELELLATAETREASRDLLRQLANELGLTEPESRSYLELVLTSGEPQASQQVGQ